MRKVTNLSIQALLNGKPFKMGNTTVEVLPNVTILKLHGNPIAYRYNDPAKITSITAAGWLTNTTKERLNGLPGVSISQVNHQWRLNGEAWDGKLIDIKTFKQ